MNITDEMVKAFVDSYDEGCCNDSSADWYCTRHALARVAPLIAAQALRSAAQAVRDMPYDLGETGWNALADQAEDAGYDRQRVLRHYRDDRSFTHATIGAACQHGYRSAAEVVEKLAKGSP